MADIIKINTSTLQKDTTSIQTRLKSVRKKLEKMKTDVAAMNKMWDGDANKAFNDAFNGDIKEMMSLCKAIDSIVDYEITAKNEYNKCERKVKEAINTINV